MSSPSPQGLPFSRLIAQAGLGPGWNGGADPLITSVVEDSRHARPGSCFVARAGTQTDGNAYIEHAIRAGAVAVVLEKTVPLPDSIARLRVDNARGVAARLASALHGVDVLTRGGRLKVVGITGTNGKSTFCYLTRAILRQAGRPTALLGTIEYDLLSRIIEASLTTPTETELVSYLAEAAAAGAGHAVMEVSSIALDQRRCDGI
ncbi:MAG: UDP-N-acetylmuramoyl-L-alanyl-D-glutamate--2,6-diaminopimelate ligase, partial [Phycisphaerae bacterium]